MSFGSSLESSCSYSSTSFLSLSLRLSYARSQSEAFNTSGVSDIGAAGLGIFAAEIVFATKCVFPDVETD